MSRLLSSLTMLLLLIFAAIPASGVMCVQPRTCSERSGEPPTTAPVNDGHLGFVDGPNLYAYVKQNPWTAFDPDGLAEEVIGHVYVGLDPFNKQYYVGETSKPVEERWSNADHNSKFGELAKRPNSVALSQEIISDLSAPGALSAKAQRMVVEREIQEKMSELFGPQGYKSIQSESGKEPQMLSDEKYQQAKKTSNPRLNSAKAAKVYRPIIVGGKSVFSEEIAEGGDCREGKSRYGIRQERSKFRGGNQQRPRPGDWHLCVVTRPLV